MRSLDVGTTLSRMHNCPVSAGWGVGAGHMPGEMGSFQWDKDGGRGPAGGTLGHCNDTPQS